MALGFTVTMSAVLESIADSLAINICSDCEGTMTVILVGISLLRCGHCSFLLTYQLTFLDLPPNSLVLSVSLAMPTRPPVPLRTYQIS